MITMLTAGLLAISAQTPPSLDEFLKAFAAARKDTVSIEAKFDQKTILPDETLPTTGALVYTRPRNIVFRTEDPKVTTMIARGRVYEYDPSLKQCLVYDVADPSSPDRVSRDTAPLDVFFLAFENDPASLKSRYDLSLFATGDPKGPSGLLVKPKPETKEDAPFEEANVYLSEKDYLPYRIRIVTGTDSQLLIEVTSIAANTKPDESKTKVTLPEGTAIVINDSLAETVGRDGKSVPLAEGEGTSAVIPAPTEPAKPMVEVKDLSAPAGTAKP